LWNVAVDQSRGEGVSPLMRGQMDGLAVLVANITGLQPAVEHAAVAVGTESPLPAGVGLLPGKQVRIALWPALQHPALLDSDLGLEFLIDGDRRLAFHLGPPDW
jgi:hypothetical protein